MKKTDYLIYGPLLTQSLGVSVQNCMRMGSFKNLPFREDVPGSIRPYRPRKKKRRKTKMTKEKNQTSQNLRVVHHCSHQYQKTTASHYSILLFLGLTILRPCLHERKWNGSIWNRSKTSTDRPCVYTGTVGTVPVWICYPCSFGSATETVPFGTVPFGSRVNGQNRMEPSQKRTDRNRGYYAMR